VPADSDRTVFRLNYPGSDLDLHVYDQFENHVGMNYDTGQIETQILGVTYSGADFNPEWIRIDGHQNEQFKLKTIALSTLENESFSIYSINTREVPATLSIKPPKISLAGYAQESITQNIIITEIGGFNDLSGISITASDLTDGMGGVIPSSNLILDMPSTDISTGSAMIVNLTIDIPTDVVEGRTYSGVITAEDDSGAIDNASVNVVILAPDLTVIFDTGSGSYPSIMGTHMGTITPNQDVTVSKLYTYPCSETGGHTEYVRIYGNGIDKSTSWKGYVGDWHNITFKDPFILEEGKTYNYTIITGSYPQIHHTPALPTANGWINCTEFTDVNGKK
jgi:hypothetical protein